MSGVHEASGLLSSYWIPKSLSFNLIKGQSFTILYTDDSVFDKYN